MLNAPSNDTYEEPSILSVLFFVFICIWLAFAAGWTFFLTDSRSYAFDFMSFYREPNYFAGTLAVTFARDYSLSIVPALTLLVMLMVRMPFSAYIASFGLWYVCFGISIFIICSANVNIPDYTMHYVGYVWLENILVTAVLYGATIAASVFLFKSTLMHRWFKRPYYEGIL